DGNGVGGVLARAAELLHPLEVALGGVLGDEAVPVVARRERDVRVAAAVPGGDAGEVAGIVDVALGIDGDVAAVVPEHVGAAAAGPDGLAVGVVFDEEGVAVASAGDLEGTESGRALERPGDVVAAVRGDGDALAGVGTGAAAGDREVEGER